MEMDFSPRSTSPMNFPLSPEPLPSRSWLSARCLRSARRRCPRNLRTCLTARSVTRRAPPWASYGNHLFVVVQPIVGPGCRERRARAAHRSGQVDLDVLFAHSDRIDAHGKARRDPAFAAAEVEIVPVPRANDRVAVYPALGERAVLVRTGGTRGDEPAAAGVEEHDRQAAVLDQRALTRCDVLDGRDPHIRHQRRPFNASSTMDRNSSTLMAPRTGRPLMRNAGVLFTPSACACAMSRSTSPAKRR